MARRLIPVLLLLLSANAHADTVITISTSSQLVNLLSNSHPDRVRDGEVIEMAPGTYSAPSGGFLIFNPNRSFTIRAATPGTVFLDGGGSERIFRFIVGNAALGGAVVFEGLTFRNGFSTIQAFGSAVTLQGSHASFIDCLFTNNVNRSTVSGSGTVGVLLGSTGLFLRSTWQDNTSQTSGAAAVILNESTLWCHECQFLRNRNNVPGHTQTATGAGFVAGGGSDIYLSNSRFEANEAAFAGGAFDIKGSYSDANPVRVIAANSTFIDNLALPDPAVTTPSPTAGGVANIEDNSVAQFYNSRFINNWAQFGGALTSYRGVIEVYDSVFRGNFATGRESTDVPPRGGAIFAISDDTTGDGDNNRPPVEVSIRDSLFDGAVSASRRGGQTVAAHTGGCVYTSGDIFRHLGLGGVPQGGTQEENSARLDITNTAFIDCDVSNLIQDGAFGGAIYTGLAIVNVDDSLFAGGNALGPASAGGGIAFLRFSDARVTGTTFADNSSGGRGGAVFALGTAIEIDDGTFIKNRVSGGVVQTSKGAALFFGPQDGVELGVEGVVKNSRFVANNGLAIYDDDRRCEDADYFNTVTYENNDFFETTFPPFVYRNILMGDTGSGIVSVDGLNDMVVDRGSGCPITDKAPLNDNVALTTQPVLGALLAVPPRIITQAAAGDPENATESYLAYAWCGTCAELNGTELTTQFGLTSANTGVHSLMVFDNTSCSGPDLDLTAGITQGPTPSATLSANPVMIPSGGSSSLTWAVPNGTFLQSAMDQGQGVLGTATGSVSVSPTLTTNYTLFALTEEGGDSAQVKVYVDEEPDVGLIFADGFESGDTSAWGAGG